MPEGSSAMKSGSAAASPTPAAGAKPAANLQQRLTSTYAHTTQRDSTEHDAFSEVSAVQPSGAHTPEDEVRALEAMHKGIEAQAPDVQRRYYQAQLDAAPRRLESYRTAIEQLSKTRGRETQLAVLRRGMAEVEHDVSDYQARLAKPSQ